MKSNLVQAILEGQGAYAGKAYFFNNDRYHRYDWAKDRAEDGYPMDNSLWGLPMGKSIDAAINGQEAYDGKAYFFLGSKYYRYDWANDAMDEGYPGDLSAWGFPSVFASGIDAAVNGVGKYAGKAYFFKGNQYIRYDWKNDAVDAGYPQNISAWNLPAPFSSGFDAVINGEGKYAGKLYFFKGNQYARYNWSTEKIEAVSPISGNWPLLQELIQFGIAKKKSFEWLGKAKPQVKSYIDFLTTGKAFVGDKVVFENALDVHFHIPTSMPVATKLIHLNQIKVNFDKMEATLKNSSNVVRGRNKTEAIADKGADTSGTPYPAYAFFNGTINITETFAKFGPLCQTAMVSHEPIHCVDSNSNSTNEFYEHGAQYSTINATQASHNASSYACFAQHIFYKSDTRYGAGKPTL